jgi:hypothetical protein
MGKLDFLSELERLEDHLRAQGSGVVQLLDQLARQAHGLAGLPPLPEPGIEDGPEAA